MDNCKCYAFYSYKGGSGRTTTLLNTTLHLINEMQLSPEKPLLLIDADLESAGLTYYFDCEDKFTDDFHECIHTCKLFNSVEPVLSDNRVFGTSGRITRSFDVALDGYFRAEEGANAQTVNAAYEKCEKMKEMFAGITLPANEMKVFERIADCCNTVKAARTTDKKTLDVGNKYTSRVEVFFQKIEEIHTSNNSAQDKKALKMQAIEEFMPATKFLDVSKYFNAPKGTVKFLGVDIKYTGKRIASNDDSEDALRYLIEKSSALNYGAVVLDSGAGVQSSADLLHRVSDVIVCCLRPSQQFISGTKTQYSDYGNIIRRQREEKQKDSSKKTVILLPTAVSCNSEEDSVFAKVSFNKIREIANAHSQFIDDTFCNVQNCIHEVSLFKWHEQILGTPDLHALDEVEKQELKQYESYEDMPEDAKNAFDSYKLLAKRMNENS